MYYDSIKMLDIELENFARIKSGMNGINKIHLNLEDFDETIYLFIGENGSGKTSTMQCFHPFAFNNASGDSGSNGELITAGMDGRKEVTYGFRDHIYHITHLYTRKKDGSVAVKSFIKEDDVELNPTGSVTMFKELIENLFGLKESFLSLLSIGNTINGFVKYTAAERKNFAVKIFRELQDYPTYYKNASAMVREIKPLLNNVSRKLEQYHGCDIDELENLSKRLDLDIGKMEEDLEDLATSSGKVDQQIESNRETIDDYDSKKARIEELFHLIDSKRSFLTNKLDEEVLLQKIKTDEENLNDIKIRRAAIEQNITLELQSKDSTCMTIETMRKNAKKIETNADVNELTELKARLESELMNLDLDGITRPPYSSSDLVKATIYLDELHGSCVDLLSNVDHIEVIPDVIDRYHKEVHLSQQLQTKYNTMQETLADVNLADSYRSILDKVKRIKLKSNCGVEGSDKCPYVLFYHTVIDTIERDTAKVKDDNRKREEEISLTKDLLETCRILKKLYKYVDDHIVSFALPTQIFDRNNFAHMYMDDREVYHKDIMATVTKLVTDFERSDDLKKQLADVKFKLQQLDQTRDAYVSIQCEIDRLSKELERSETSLDYYHRSLESFVTEQTKTEDRLKRLYKDLEIVQEMSNLRLEMKVLNEEVSLMENKMGQIQDLIQQSRSLQAQANIIRSNLSAKRQQKQELVENINNFYSLTEEQKRLSELLDQKIAIQRAVSPSQGIPVEIIRDFMKGELLIEVNQRLAKVYHNRMKLDIKNTIISDNEFTIPYTWNGTPVADISRASDGQKAILTLAFSITLIKMITEMEGFSFYNIMLMDEMDTTLDNHGRAVFIEMLEDFAKEINTKQIFTISHNQMFDGYPVVLLMTSDYVVSRSMKGKSICLYKGGNCD